MSRLAFSVLTLAAFCGAMAQDQPAPPAPARKGEAELKEVLKSFASLGSFEAAVAKFTGSGDGNLQELDGALQFSWRGPSSFRAQYQGMWGDTILIIREGSKILSDDLEVGGFASLRDAGEKFVDSWAASGGERMLGPYPLLFTGEAALPLLAPASGTLEFRTVGTRTRRFVMTGGRFGTVTLQASKRDEAWNLDFIETSRQTGRGFGGSVMRMETASISPLSKVSSSFWSAEPEKGVRLTDLRAKKEG